MSSSDALDARVSRTSDDPYVFSSGPFRVADMAGTRRSSMTPRLGFSVFDGDNHMYETRDALTKFLPPEYRGAIRYVEVDGRTKIATLGQISDYTPNPTSHKLAAPGAQEDYFHNGNPDGKSHREILGKAIERPHAMRERA